MTRETFAEIVTILEATHRMGLSQQEREVWWLLIRELPDDAAKAATLHVCRTSPYPPKPAHLVNAVRGEPANGKQLLEEEASMAIRHLEAHLSDYEAVNLGPILNAVVRQMGGPDVIVAEVASGDWKFRREEARRIYKALRRRGVPRELAVPEWPMAPHRIEGPEDVPELQQRVFLPREVPALPPVGERTAELT